MIKQTLLFTLLISVIYADTRIDELEDLVEKIETKSLSDKIEFSPELRLRSDFFQYNNRDSSSQLITTNTTVATDTTSDTRGESGDAFNKVYQPHYSLRFRLNMTTSVYDNTKFFGRLLITKDTQNNERLCVLSRAITATSDSVATTFDIDRAYFDWRVADNTIFTLGILPTTGGLSSNLIQNTPRKSVFPSLMFDMTTYGVALSTSLFDNTWIRTVIAKAYTLNDNIFYYQCNRETIYNAGVFGLFFETKIPLIPNNTYYIGVNTLLKLKATPYLGASNASVDMKNAKEMGNIHNFGSGIEVKNVYNFLDFFAHASMSVPKPNGNTLDYTTGTDPFTNDSYARGTMINNNGYAIYIGTRATIKQFNKAKIGIEYNQGSKYWFSATQGSEDVFNKLATRGNAIEAYYIQPFNEIISLRFGYLQIDEYYTGSGWHFGEPAIKNGRQTNLYYLLNAYF